MKERYMVGRRPLFTSALEWLSRCGFINKGRDYEYDTAGLVECYSVTKVYRVSKTR